MKSKIEKLAFGLENYFNKINNDSMLIEKNNEYFLNLKHPDADYFIKNITGQEISIGDIIEVKIDHNNIYFKLKQDVEYVNIIISMDDK